MPAGQLVSIEPSALVEHFFRHESGKLVASLVRRFGIRHFDLVEDMVQAALAEALLAWKQSGVPKEPAAWMRRVAINRILDTLRREQKFNSFASQFAETAETHISDKQRLHDDDALDEDAVQDSLLRMLFTCCHPELPADAVVPLTLKTVCGFVATVRKRIYRAKRNLIQRNVRLELPSVGQLSARLQTVHNVLYLMFNEGYASSVADESLRLDVCEEAARLRHLLTENSYCCTGATHALLALMLFHASRFNARIDHEGALVLLEDQDRQLWDRRLIARAMDYFKLASEDKTLTSYHLEAAIAMYHCASPRFADTDWNSIIALYDRLIQSVPSPIYQLNRSIAIGQRDGPVAAIALLEKLRDEPRLLNFHLLDAALGEFCRLANQLDAAQAYFSSALRKTNLASEQALLHRRIQQCCTD
jgi:predicted RNA polymerase sigma factor